ncbi:MAG TPA: MATE family efflux transporter [Gemmatimonadales bacterium]|nr:MATE family efflux transporter [Gemmatimonadales bacterium]
MKPAVLPAPGTTRQLVTLALPIIAVNLGMMLMGAVDTLMIGRVSAAALASVALGNVYFFCTAVFGIGVTLVLDPVISQAIGAGDRQGVSRGVQRGIVLAILVSLPLMLLLLLAEPAVRLLGQPEELVPGVSTYVTILIPGVLPFLLFSVARQTLQAMHRVAPVVVVIVLANLANVVLNYWLIFGGLGVQPMGIAGSAWATTASRWLMLGALLVIARRELLPSIRYWSRDVFDLSALGALLRLGLPIGAQLEIEMATFGAVAMLMGRFGTLEVASHQVALNLASLTFMVPMGVGMSAAVLVGKAIGAGDQIRARAAARSALLVGAGFMVCTAVMFTLVPSLLAGLYTSDVAVVAFAATLLPIAGVFQVFDGLQVVSAGILRGLGDTGVPMLINLFGFGVVGLTASLLLAYRTTLGPVGLWWGLVIGITTVAVTLLARVAVMFRRRLVRVEV